MHSSPPADDGKSELPTDSGRPVLGTRSYVKFQAVDVAVRRSLLAGIRTGRAVPSAGPALSDKRFRLGGQRHEVFGQVDDVVWE